MNNNITPVSKNDLEGFKKVLDSCGLFPSEYLKNMISDYFKNPETQEIWFTYDDQNTPVAIGYCLPEKLTNGTHNLLAMNTSGFSLKPQLTYFETDNTLLSE